MELGSRKVPLLQQKQTQISARVGDLAAKLSLTGGNLRIEFVPSRGKVRRSGLRIALLQENRAETHLKASGGIA